MSAKARVIMVLVAILCVPAFSLTAAADDDPFMGNWKLNTKKSAGPAERREMKSYTRKHEPIPNGMKVSREEVDADGVVSHPYWTAKFDGKDHPLIGEPGGFVDSLYLKRLDKHTIVGGSKKNGLLINLLRWEVSEDGKYFFWRATRVNPPELEGSVVVNVFEKQP